MSSFDWNGDRKKDAADDFIDYHIINDGSLEKVIDTILDIMKKYDKSPL